MSANLPPGYREPLGDEPDPAQERVIEALEDFGVEVNHAREKLRNQLERYHVPPVDPVEADATSLVTEAYDIADRLKRERYPTARELRRGLATRQRVFAKTGTEQG